MFVILGATGKVGRTTIKQLRSQGAPVRAVVRKSSNADDLSPNKSQTTFITVIMNVVSSKEDFSRACNGDFLAVHDGFAAIAVRRPSFPL
jgi:nucleoside-diphosphate-sugar epimerase